MEEVDTKGIERRKGAKNRGMRAGDIIRANAALRFCGVSPAANPRPQTAHVRAANTCCVSRRLRMRRGREASPIIPIILLSRGTYPAARLLEA